MKYLFLLLFFVATGCEEPKNTGVTFSELNPTLDRCEFQLDSCEDELDTLYNIVEDAIEKKTELIAKCTKAKGKWIVSVSESGWGSWTCEMDL